MITNKIISQADFLKQWKAINRGAEKWNKISKKLYKQILNELGFEVTEQENTNNNFDCK